MGSEAVLTIRHLNRGYGGRFLRAIPTMMILGLALTSCAAGTTSPEPLTALSTEPAEFVALPTQTPQIETPEPTPTLTPTSTTTPSPTPTITITPTPEPMVGEIRTNPETGVEESYGENGELVEVTSDIESIVSGEMIRPGTTTLLYSSHGDRLKLTDEGGQIFYNYVLDTIINSPALVEYWQGLGLYDEAQIRSYLEEHNYQTPTIYEGADGREVIFPGYKSDAGNLYIWAHESDWRKPDIGDLEVIDLSGIGVVSISREEEAQLQQPLLEQMFGSRVAGSISLSGKDDRLMYDRSGKPVIIVTDADADLTMDPISDSSMPSINDSDFGYFFTAHVVAAIRPLSAPDPSNGANNICTSVDLNRPAYRGACVPDGLEGTGGIPYLGANRETVRRIFGETPLVEK